MKLSMEQAATVIGKSKKTIYNHKDRNKFSFDTDEEGKAVIDASELLRVYGNKPEIIQRLKELQEPTNENGSVITPAYTKKSAPSVKESEIVDYKIKLVKLEAELEKEKALKMKVEESLDYFKEALEKAQDTAQKVTLLLEDQRNNKPETNNDWQKSLKALEDRIANQETSIQEKIAQEAEKAAKEAQEKEELRAQLEEKEAILAKKEEALKVEKSKSFLHKLLGK
jgi:chromosome segregation ATPase